MTAEITMTSRGMLTSDIYNEDLRCVVTFRESHDQCWLGFRANVDLFLDLDEDVSELPIEVLKERFPGAVEEETENALEDFANDVKRHQIVTLLGLKYEGGSTSHGQVEVLFGLPDRAKIDALVAQSETIDPESSKTITWLYDIAIALEGAPILRKIAKVRRLLCDYSRRCRNLRTNLNSTTCDLNLIDSDLSAELMVTDQTAVLSICSPFDPSRWESNGDMSLVDRERAEYEHVKDRVESLLERTPLSIDDNNMLVAEVLFHCVIDLRELSLDALEDVLQTICRDA